MDFGPFSNRLLFLDGIQPGQEKTNISSPQTLLQSKAMVLTVARARATVSKMPRDLCTALAYLLLRYLGIPPGVDASLLVNLSPTLSISGPTQAALCPGELDFFGEPPPFPFLLLPGLHLSARS